MKTIKYATVGAVALLFASTLQTFAIEGLQISLVCSNVVLSWPSDPSESYIVQYRRTLNATDVWQSVALDLPADQTTNITVFVHSNIVQNPNCGSSGSPHFAMSSSRSLAMSTPEPTELVPMVMPADGSETAVPLALYPPGFDLSGFVIFDPITGESMSGAGYSVQSLSPLAARMNGFQSMDDGLGDGPSPQGGSGPTGNTQEPETGFYRVVREGVHLFGLTNGTVLSGIVQLPIEAGNDQGTLTSVTISANGSPIDTVAVLTPQSDSPMQFTVDTTRLANGDYYLQPGGTWRVAVSNTVDSPFVTLGGAYVLVTVSNAISCPDWVTEFGDSGAIIRFYSIYPDIDWQVDIYGSAGDYVGSFTGHSDIGQAEVDWDLTGTNGVARTDLSFETVIKVKQSSTGLTAVLDPPLVRVVDNYPDQGQWIVTRIDQFPSSYQNFSLYNSAINSIAGMAEQAGGILPNDHRSFGHAFLVRSTSQTDSLADWYTLLTSMTNRSIRNFYYVGHGSPTDIGDDYGGLGSAAVAGILNNLIYAGTTVLTNTARYRFVWIDGCNTANGSWPSAFGIGSRINVPYSDFKSRPAAFCGWAVEKNWGSSNPTTGAGTIKQSYAYYRSNFTFYWQLEHNTLSDAHQNAWNASFDGEVGNLLVIYGYWGLHWTELNQKSDWP